MDQINFSQSGGFPLETETLQIMQKQYNLLQGLTGAFNDITYTINHETRTILKGCYDPGSGHVSTGYLEINGEVFYFEGGTKQDNVIIVEEVEEREFKDGVTKPVYTKRTVKFGSGTDEISWSSFERPLNLVNLSRQFKDFEDRVNRFLSAFEGEYATLLYRHQSYSPGGPSSVANIPNGWSTVANTTVDHPYVLSKNQVHDYDFIKFEG